MSSDALSYLPNPPHNPNLHNHTSPFPAHKVACLVIHHILCKYLRRYELSLLLIIGDFLCLLRALGRFAWPINRHWRHQRLPPLLLVHWSVALHLFWLPIATRPLTWAPMHNQPFRKRRLIFGIWNVPTLPCRIPPCTELFCFMSLIVRAIDVHPGEYAGLRFIQLIGQGTWIGCSL